MNTRSLVWAAVFTAFSISASLPMCSAATQGSSVKVGHPDQLEAPVVPSFLQEETVLSDEIETQPADKGPVLVVVDKTKHITYVLQNHSGKLVAVYKACNTTGKASTPTPEGRMMVREKRLDPEWKPPVSIDPKQHKIAGFSKNKHNPLGVAWLGLSEGFIGLHGTNDERTIGRSVSHGCVRHKNADIQRLYSLIPVGTPVYIVHQMTGTELLPKDVEYMNDLQDGPAVALF